MAITSKDAILTKVKELLGDSTSDEALSLFEDISDTFDSATAQSKSDEEWQKKLDETERQWREKYRDRFFGTETDEDPIKPDPQDLTNLGEAEEKKMTYEDLFKEVD